MRAQATRRDQEDRLHPFRRACPDWSYRISQPRQRGEGPYSRSKVGAHLWHEPEGLQGGVAGDSDYSDDSSPSSWAAAERDDNDLYIWEEVPKEKTPEGPNGGGNNDGFDDNGDGDDGSDDGGDPGGDDPFGMHPMCCAACRHSISELYASVDKCFQAMEAMRKRVEDLERVVEDDYKLLNHNVRKLFGMVGNMKGKWCNSCGKYH
jgi:hypothetical protein